MTEPSMPGLLGIHKRYTAPTATLVLIFETDREKYLFDSVSLFTQRVPITPDINHNPLLDDTIFTSTHKSKQLNQNHSTNQLQSNPTSTSIPSQITNQFIQSNPDGFDYTHFTTMCTNQIALVDTFSPAITTSPIYRNIQTGQHSFKSEVGVDILFDNDVLYDLTIPTPLPQKSILISNNNIHTNNVPTSLTTPPSTNPPSTTHSTQSTSLDPTSTTQPQTTTIPHSSQSQPSSQCHQSQHIYDPNLDYKLILSKSIISQLLGAYPLSYIQSKLPTMSSYKHHIEPPPIDSNNYVSVPIQPFGLVDPIGPNYICNLYHDHSQSTTQTTPLMNNYIISPLDQLEIQSQQLQLPPPSQQYQLESNSQLTHIQQPSQQQSQSQQSQSSQSSSKSGQSISDSISNPNTATTTTHQSTTNSIHSTCTHTSTDYTIRDSTIPIFNAPISTSTSYLPPTSTQTHSNSGINTTNQHPLENQSEISPDNPFLILINMKIKSDQRQEQMAQMQQDRLAYLKQSRGSKLNQNQNQPHDLQNLPPPTHQSQQYQSQSQLNQSNQYTQYQPQQHNRVPSQQPLSLVLPPDEFSTTIQSPLHQQPHQQSHLNPTMQSPRQVNLPYSNRNNYPLQPLHQPYQNWNNQYTQLPPLSPRFQNQQQQNQQQPQLQQQHSNYLYQQQYQQPQQQPLPPPKHPKSYFPDPYKNLRFLLWSNTPEIVDHVNLSASHLTLGLFQTQNPFDLYEIDSNDINVQSKQLQSQSQPKHMKHIPPLQFPSIKDGTDALSHGNLFPFEIMQVLTTLFALNTINTTNTPQQSTPSTTSFQSTLESPLNTTNSTPNQSAQLFKLFQLQILSLVYRALDTNMNPPTILSSDQQHNQKISNDDGNTSVKRQIFTNIQKTPTINFLPIKTDDAESKTTPNMIVLHFNLQSHIIQRQLCGYQNQQNISQNQHINFNQDIIDTIIDQLISNVLSICRNLFSPQALNDSLQGLEYELLLSKYRSIGTLHKQQQLQQLQQSSTQFIDPQEVQIAQFIEKHGILPPGTFRHSFATRTILPTFTQTDFDTVINTLFLPQSNHHNSTSNHSHPLILTTNTAQPYSISSLEHIITSVPSINNVTHDKYSRYYENNTIRPRFASFQSFEQPQQHNQSLIQQPELITSQIEPDAVIDESKIDQYRQLLSTYTSTMTDIIQTSSFHRKDIVYLSVLNPLLIPNYISPTQLLDRKDMNKNQSPPINHQHDVAAIPVPKLINSTSLFTHLNSKLKTKNPNIKVPQPEQFHEDVLQLKDFHGNPITTEQIVQNYIGNIAPTLPPQLLHEVIQPFNNKTDTNTTDNILPNNTNNKIVSSNNQSQQKQQNQQQTQQQTLECHLDRIDTESPSLSTSSSSTNPTTPVPTTSSSSTTPSKKRTVTLTSNSTSLKAGVLPTAIYNPVTQSDRPLLPTPGDVLDKSIFLNLPAQSCDFVQGTRVYQRNTHVHRSGIQLELFSPLQQFFGRKNGQNGKNCQNGHNNQNQCGSTTTTTTTPISLSKLIPVPSSSTFSTFISQQSQYKALYLRQLLRILKNNIKPTLLPSNLQYCQQQSQSQQSQQPQSIEIEIEVQPQQVIPYIQPYQHISMLLISSFHPNSIRPSLQYNEIHRLREETIYNLQHPHEPKKSLQQIDLEQLPSTQPSLTATGKKRILHTSEATATSQIPKLIAIEHTPTQLEMLGVVVNDDNNNNDDNSSNNNDNNDVSNTTNDNNAMTTTPTNNNDNIINTTTATTTTSTTTTTNQQPKQPQQQAQLPPLSEQIMYENGVVILSDGPIHIHQLLPHISYKIGQASKYGA